jgi:hypothetical protein
MAANIEQILRTYGGLKAHRQPWESTWQAIMDTMMPAYNDIQTTLVPGHTRTSRLLDTTGMQSAMTLGGHFSTDITNFQMQWFQLRMSYEPLNQVKSIAVWLDAAAKAMQDHMSSGGVPKAVDEMYLQFAIAGTGALFSDRTSVPGLDGKYGLLGQSLPVGTYCISDNADGRVDTLYRDLELSPRQAIQHFGASNVHEQVLRAMEHGDTAHKPTAYLHAVYPRNDRDPSREDQSNMPYASCYVDMLHKHICSEGGYRWFPYLVSRWQKLASWSPYGFGPGHIALPEVLTLNQMDKDVLTALQTYINPSYWTDDPDAVGRVRLTPGYVNPIAQGRQIQPMRGPERFDIGKLGIEERRQRVKEIFFVDLLQALPPVDKPGYPTAYELAQRLAMSARRMGPALMSLLGEFLNPWLDIVFGTMMEEGDLPQVPDELAMVADQGYGRMTVDYQGPLARAQKWDEVEAIDRWIESLDRQYQVTQDISVYDVLNRNEANWRTGKVRGVPAVAMNDKEEAARLAQERAEAQQEAQEAEAMREDAKALGPAANMVKALTPPAQETAA